MNQGLSDCAGRSVMRSSSSAVLLSIARGQLLVVGDGLEQESIFASTRSRSSSVSSAEWLTKS